LHFLATAGHASIVARLLENGAIIEAQSERTKDTALSLACSGGRQEVVEVLLKKGANREHRNVSDYTGKISITIKYIVILFS
jgi:ankyrin repeat domain-containing protein 17